MFFPSHNVASLFQVWKYLVVLLRVQQLCYSSSLSHTPFLIVWKGARDLSSKPVRNTFRAPNYRKAVWIESATSNNVPKAVSMFEGRHVAHERESAHVLESSDMQSIVEASAVKTFGREILKQVSVLFFSSRERKKKAFEHSI